MFETNSAGDYRWHIRITQIDCNFKPKKKNLIRNKRFIYYGPNGPQIPFITNNPHPPYSLPAPMGCLQVSVIGIDISVLHLTMPFSTSNSPLESLRASILANTWTILIMPFALRDSPALVESFSLLPTSCGRLIAHKTIKHDRLLEIIAVPMITWWFPVVLRQEMASHWIGIAAENCIMELSIS